MNKTGIWKHFFFVSFITFTLSACATKPREVTAEVPLVTTPIELPGNDISKIYWESLSKDTVTTLVHPQYKITLNRPYTSALGKKCREIRIHRAGNVNKQVACLYADVNNQTYKWRLMPTLESNAEDIVL